MVLDESGYTEMWRQDKTPEAAGRLENLKELVRAMEEFPDLAAFLEHVSLVMEAEEANGAERVSIMTLHGAKGLEFETVYLPGWEEGLFPHQRSLDEQGRAGLEEERRLAYVGVTRAKRRAKIFFASNRRIRGLWQPTTPSRFIDNLPSAHIDVVEAPGGSQYGAYGVSRFAPAPARPRHKPARRAHDNPKRSKAKCWRAVRQHRVFAPEPAFFIRNSARAPSPPSTAANSPSISTRPAARWCSKASCRQGENIWPETGAPVFNLPRSASR